MSRLSASTAAAPARIDWELLPSLRNLLGARRNRSQPTWMDTVQSDFTAPRERESGDAARLGKP